MRHGGKDKTMESENRPVVARDRGKEVRLQRSSTSKILGVMDYVVVVTWIYTCAKTYTQNQNPNTLF